MDIKKLEEYVSEKLINDNTGHDWGHTRRVLKNALEIAKEYPETDLEILKISCLLHDIAFKDGFVEEHNIVGAKQSEEFLEGLNFPREKIQKITL